MDKLDLSGRRFGRLVAVAEAERRHGERCWLFRCDCGAEVVRLGYNVRKGLTQSCGCLSREMSSARLVTHGHTRGGRVSRAFSVWSAMKARCLNPNTKSFRDYGARGITVCDRWMTFANFLEDMGEPPAGAQIDRIDNGKGYEPGNCRWASKRANAQNRRNTVIVNLRGKRVPASEVARMFGVRYGSLMARVRKGEDAEAAAKALPKVRAG